MTASSVAGEQWFKRYNSKEPEKGGARKSMATRPKDWADQANEALERAGSRGADSRRNSGGAVSGCRGGW